MVVRVFPCLPVAETFGALYPVPLPQYVQRRGVPAHGAHEDHRSEEPEPPDEDGRVLVDRAPEHPGVREDHQQAGECLDQSS